MHIKKAQGRAFMLYCQRRVRYARNARDCGSYNIDVTECECQNALRLAPHEKNSKIDMMLCYVNRHGHETHHLANISSIDLNKERIRNHEEPAVRSNKVNDEKKPAKIQNTEEGDHSSKSYRNNKPVGKDFKIYCV